MDGFIVSYAPSGTLYAHLRQPPQPQGQAMLALADPVFQRPGLKAAVALPGPAESVDRVLAQRRATDAWLANLRQRGDDWRSLPGTRTEAEALRRLHPPEQFTLLLAFVLIGDTN